MSEEKHEIRLETPTAGRTVINVHPSTPDTAAPDHVVWSLFNALFFNPCCLGFVAFAYSVKARDRKMVGDVMGAQGYASTAKCLNIWAMVLGILVTIGLIVLMARHPALFDVRAWAQQIAGEV